jgi:hypothetical protein
MQINIRLVLIIFLTGVITCSAAGAEDMSDDIVKVTVNNSTFDVKLENNSATRELVNRLHDGNITIKAKEYGGFEKVGDLGFSLPTSDENVNTSPGDIVLYQSNQISLFYDSHSWSYTKIGKIQNVTSDELVNILAILF